jgi:hypothetical protein
VIFEGSATVAARYVGKAKALGLWAFTRGLSSYILRLSPGVQLRVRNDFASESCKIYIRAFDYEPVYQFYGSEEILDKTYEDPYVSGRYLPRGNWTLVRSSGNDAGVLKFKYKPLLSSLRASSDTPPKWEYNSNPYLSIQPGVEESTLYLAPMHQPDGAGVRKWQSIDMDSQWLVSTWAEPTPNHGVWWLSGGSGYYANPNITDQGFDFPPVVYTGARGARIMPETDWWRAACLRDVVSEEYGPRRFVIMVTIKHEFYCYPVAAAGALNDPLDPNKGNVAAEFVQQVTPTLPAWVTIGDVGKDASDPATAYYEPQPRWVFSPEGDKAAAVMFSRDDQWEDTYRGHARCVGNTEPVDPLKEHCPGVVEVAFDVVITGEDLEDFTFTVTVEKDWYAQDTGVGYVAVGYAALDFPDLPGEVAYNDLLVLKHRYYFGDPLFADATDFADPARVPYIVDTSVKVVLHPPIAAVAEVVRGDGTTPVMRWLAYYTAYYYSALDTRLGIAESDMVYPAMSSLSDWGGRGSAGGVRYLTFSTAISGMDLSTLTFCLGSSLLQAAVSSDYGVSYVSTPFDLDAYFYQSPMCASAAYVSTHSLGVLDEERFVGHPDMKEAAKEYFTLASPVPDIDSMTEFGPKATISSTNVSVSVATPPSKCWDLFEFEYYRVVPAGDFYWDVQGGWADITLDTGIDDNVLEEEVVFPYHHTINYATGAFYQFGDNKVGAHMAYNETAHTVYLPRLPAYFSGQDHYMPGMRHMERVLDGSVWRREGWNAVPPTYNFQPGDWDYTDFPMGLIVHSTITQTVCEPMNNPFNMINAEPDGSYAVFFGPFAAPTSIVRTHDDLDERLPNFSSFTMEQDVMDVIRVRKAGKEGALATGKTSHIDAMNGAFNLSLGASDYAFEFVIAGWALESMSKLYQTGAPDYFIVGDRLDYNYAYIDPAYGYNKSGRVGGAVMLGPTAIGWMRTAYNVNKLDATYVVTHSVFDSTSLFAGGVLNYYLGHPTPRMEGLFGKRYLPPTED